jgi:hypothetical protein
LSTRAAVTDNVRWGAGLGLIFGAIYSVIALGIYATRGSRPFATNGVSLLALIAAYFGGGLAAGVVIGLFRPLLRWRLGAMVVGFIGAIPVGAAFRTAENGLARWTSDDVIVVAMFAGALGAPAGLMMGRRL